VLCELNEHSEKYVNAKVTTITITITIIITVTITISITNITITNITITITTITNITITITTVTITVSITVTDIIRARGWVTFSRARRPSQHHKSRAILDRGRVINISTASIVKPAFMQLAR
jgi:hypothetical protein